MAYWWAGGSDLDSLLGPDDMAAGDFVRTTRQILDVTRQVRDAAAGLGADEVAETARQALALVDRGVVAAGGVA